MKKHRSRTEQYTNDFMIIPYQSHYRLFIDGELEGDYDSQDECIDVLKEKGYNYF